MAARVGTSRLPLREALRIMTSQGWLVHRPNQGYFVAKLSRSELDQILLLLEFLETKILESVTAPTEDGLEELQHLNLALSRAAADGDVGAQMQLNREFHALVFSFSDRALYAGEVDRLSALAEPYLRLRFTEAEAARTVAEHADLIDALAAHDLGRCVAIQNAHRSAFAAALLSLLH